MRGRAMLVAGSKMVDEGDIPCHVTWPRTDVTGEVPARPVVLGVREPGTCRGLLRWAKALSGQLTSAGSRLSRLVVLGDNEAVQ
jgi:hypothetical protein